MLRTLRIPGYILAVITGGVLLYVANNLLRWDVPYLTHEFSRVIGIINLSLGASIAGNLFLIFRDIGDFRYLVKAVLSLLALAAAYMLHTVFPFELPLFLEGTVRMGLVAVMIGIGMRLAFNLLLFTYKISVGRD